ncbi:MAG: hypothetical protein MJ192_10490 [Clostridia bacterium]|nr:hypothetical protein [Clostridia bacterium]
MKKNLFRILWFVLLSGCAAASAMLSAAAYLDPSVVSYTIQAVAGIVIAAGAVFFVWWRKVKKKVSDKLGIDENAGKEVEGDLVINEDAGIEAAEAVEAVPVDENKQQENN